MLVESYFCFILIQLLKLSEMKTSYLSITDTMDEQLERLIDDRKGLIYNSDFPNYGSGNFSKSKSSK